MGIGRARRRMDAHDGERTRSSRSGLQSRDAETMNWSEQEAFQDDSRQCDEEWHRMDAHASPANGKAPSAWTRIATQRSKQDAVLSLGGLRDAAVLPYT